MNETCLKNFLIGSLIFHVVIIIIGMMLSHSPTIRHTFVVLGVHSQKATKTLFKRFEDPIPVPVQTGGGIKKTSSVSAKKKVSAPKSKQPAAPKKGVSLEQDKKKTEQSKTMKKSEPAKKSVTEKKVIQEKKPVQKKNQALPKKEKPPAKKQPEQTKKITEKKKTQEQKCQDLKDHQGKKATPQKLNEINHKTKDQQPNIDDQKMVNEDVFDDEIFTVSFNDQEMVLYDHVIRREIGQRWQSPPGVPKGTECTVRFEVASSGSVKSAELIRRSHVLIFDLGALRAARTCTFARCLWGKIFQVDFRQ